MATRFLVRFSSVASGIVSVSSRGTYVHIMGTRLKFNSSPLKNDGKGRRLSFWCRVTFQGRAVMLNFREVKHFAAQVGTFYAIPSALRELVHVKLYEST